MAVWPFHRKSRRKRLRSDMQSDPESTVRDNPDEQARARRRKTEPASQTQSQSQSQTQTQTQMHTQPTAPIKRQPNKLHRREYSFEKGAEDALAIERRRTGRRRRSGAVGQGPAGPHSHSYHTKDFVSPSNTRAHPDSDLFSRMPTLHNKRNAEQMAHKKSSKRRKADHAREAEVKAMSNFEPVRPAAEPWQSGRPMKRDTRRVVTGLGLGFRRSFDREQPVSDLSLPLPGSIHSSLSSDAEQVSFMVSGLEALAPRPTLRYTVHPRRYSPPPERNDRHVSVRHKLSVNGSIAEATLKAHKRIDDLADDLTAHDLRELMERDGRRRAKKQEQDRARLERRLARRAEKERAAQRNGQASPVNMDRGVLGRESVGLGIEPESAVVTSSTPRASPKPSQSPPPDRSSKQLGKRPAEDMDDDDEAAEQAAQGPLAHFHRADSIPLDNASMTSAPEDLPVPRTRSPRKRIMLMTRSSRSRSPPPPPVTEPPKTDATVARVKSEGSIKRLRRSWSNLFRWGSRKRKAEHSSFSNTSRDSMTGHNAPQFTPIPNALTRKLSSNVPKRTLSRFREDLPELPLSPPQSSGGPPAHERTTSVIMEQYSPDLDTEMDLGEAVLKRNDTPMSPVETSGRVTASLPTSVDPSPEPVSIALGSVDSEGSWFGKKTSVRRSNPTPTPLTPPPYERQRQASITSFDSHHDPDLPTQDVADDDDGYFADENDLSGFTNRRSSGSRASHARVPSDESADARWGTVGGKTPNVVEPHAGFIKSHEGLLNTFSEDGHGSERGDVGNHFDPDERGKENTFLHANHAKRRSKGSVSHVAVSPRNSVNYP
ncbi:unnamed protein product [Discula destructiva]